MKKPSLVLLPGQLSNARMWTPVATLLQDVCEAHIAEQNRAAVISIADIATDVLQQLPKRCTLVAHGMAGFIAFEILRRSPERIAAIALLGTLAPADNAAQTARRERYLELVSAGRFLEIIDERIPVVVHPQRLTDPAVATVVRQMAVETGAEIFVRQTRAIMGRIDSRPTLATIRCPTVLIWGRQDGMATDAHQLEMRAAIADATLEVLEDTGHFSSLERPAAVAAILRRLLDRG